MMCARTIWVPFDHELQYNINEMNVIFFLDAITIIMDLNVKTRSTHVSSGFVYI